MDKVILCYDDNGTNREWYWRDQKKQYWKTWKPKKEDVIVINLTNKKEKGRIQQEIWDDILKLEHPKKETKKGIYKLRK
jgi:hypothetical protein|tara:strand:+ start:1179 stop:1415 length:237 start_codon:yes stop_codon:yes gene_type:complete